MGKGRGLRQAEAVLKGSRPPRQFPESYRRLPPGRRLSWLAGEDCAALLERGELTTSQVQNETRRLERERLRISRITPSPARISDYMEGEAFPPPADHTPMVMADVMLNPHVEQDVLWPRYYLRGKLGRDATTYDVIVLRDQQLRTDLYLPGGFSTGRESTTESSSSLALLNMAEALDRLEETRLLSESEKQLKAEIEYAIKTGDVHPSAR